MIWIYIVGKIIRLGYFSVKFLHKNYAFCGANMNLAVGIVEKNVQSRLSFNFEMESSGRSYLHDVCNAK